MLQIPEYLNKVTKEASFYENLNKVNVVAFNGRESDAPHGIWGIITKRLGKKEVFNQH